MGYGLLKHCAIILTRHTPTLRFADVGLLALRASCLFETAQGIISLYLRF